MTLCDVAAADELGEGEMRAVKAAGRELLLAKVEGSIYATDGICTHALGYLDEGELDGHRVLCPLHEGSFDIRTGAALTAPAEEPLRCYAVRVEAGRVLIAIEESAA